MDLIKIIDENDKPHYINKEHIKEVFEREDGVTVVTYGEYYHISTKESLEDLHKRLVLGWK